MGEDVGAVRCLLQVRVGLCMCSREFSDRREEGCCMFFAWCKARRRCPFVSPALMSLMFDSGRRLVDWTSRAVRHHGFQTSSPLVCDRMRGGLIENLMMLLVDLGS